MMKNILRLSSGLFLFAGIILFCSGAFAQDTDNGQSEAGSRLNAGTSMKERTSDTQKDISDLKDARSDMDNVRSEMGDTKSDTQDTGVDAGDNKSDTGVDNSSTDK